MPVLAHVMLCYNLFASAAYGIQLWCLLLLFYAGAAAGSLEHAVAINNIDVASEYIQKLRQELDGHAGESWLF